MYRVRIPIAILILSVVAGVLWLDDRLSTNLGSTALLALLVGTALAEFYSLLGLSGRSRFQGVVAGLFLLGCLYCQEEGLARGILEPVPAGLFLVSVTLLFPRLLARDPTPWPDRPSPGLPEGSLRESAVLTLGLVYVVFLLSYLLRIRLLDVPGGPPGERDGILLVVFVILSAKGADMGGYLVGRAFGKRKILPRVSPKKSLEGTLAGLALSMGLAALLSVLFQPVHRIVCLPTALGFGFAAGVLSLGGDLVESAVKRRVGAKDSQRLVPEFGGVLDIVDSLMFASPAGYYLLEALIRRGPPLPAS